MALSILKFRCWRCHSFLPTFKTVRNRSNSPGYYVLLPEIPPDTEETNPIMRTTHLPDFENLSADRLVTGGAKLCIEHDVELGKNIKAIEDGQMPASFENLFDTLEATLVPMSFARQTAVHMQNCFEDPSLQRAQTRVTKQVNQSINERVVNKVFYTALQSVKATENLDPLQKRMVDKCILDAKVSGIEKTGSKKRIFVESMLKLKELEHMFELKVERTQKDFQHHVSDIRSISSASPSVTRLLMKGVTLRNESFFPFMAHSTNRSERENVWRARVRRAGTDFRMRHLSNQPSITKILQLRRDTALSLGYDNFYEQQLETKMAGDVENVSSFIDALEARFKPEADEEIQRLQKFAESEGFDGDLQPWDISCWSERLRNYRFQYVPEDVQQFFPFEHVLQRLLDLCHALFGVHFENVTSEVSTWHPDVLVFRALDSESGNELAYLYIDPYERPGKTANYSYCGRDRSDVVGTIPISYLNLILPRSSGDQCLMTETDLYRLFYLFGNSLQQMLTTVPYSLLAGQNNLEKDAQAIVSNFMGMLSRTPNILRNIASHHETAESIPEELLERIVESRFHMSATNIMEDAYMAALDIELHSSYDEYRDVIRGLWTRFVPYQLHPKDEHLASEVRIFGRDYCPLYCRKWAEMVAANIFEPFEEAGDDQEKIFATGRRFRDTFLSSGSSESTMKIFRQFRGRDPSDSAFINYWKR